MIKKLGGWVAWILILEFLIFFMLGLKLRSAGARPSLHIVTVIPPSITESVIETEPRTFAA